MVTVPRRAAEERGGRGPFFPRGGTGALSRTSFYPNRASATTKKLWLTQ